MLRKKITSTQKKYFSVAETANYTGISIRTIRNYLNDSANPLPHYRIGVAGRIIRINRNEIDQWLQGFKIEDNTMDIDFIVNDLI